MLLLSICVLPGVSTQASDAPTPEHPEDGALWIAESEEVLKIALADGRILLEVPEIRDARSLAVDPLRRTLWVHLPGRLLEIDLLGRRLSELVVPTPWPSSIPPVVDPESGNLWLATGSDVLEVRLQGGISPRHRLETPARALALDSQRSRLWVATETRVLAFDTRTGTLVEALAVAGSQALAVSPATGALWIATSGGLERTAGETTPVERWNLPAITRLVPDDRGGVWAIAGPRLIHLDARGRPLSAFEPLGPEAELEQLTFDAESGAVWVTDSSAIARVDPGSQVAFRLVFEPPLDIRGLALWLPQEAPDEEDSEASASPTPELSEGSPIALPPEVTTPLRAPDTADKSSSPSPTTLCLDDPFDGGTLDTAWTSVAVGDAQPGGLEIVGDRLRIGSTGSSLWQDDHATFVRRQAEGDFRAEVTVTDLPVDQGGGFRKAGLMVRDGILGRDPRVMVNIVPHHSGPGQAALQFGFRDAFGVAGDELAAPVAIALPVRVAIERRGDTFTVYYRSGAGPWIQPLPGGIGGQVDIEMATTVDVGLAVSSYDPALAMTAEFDDFALCGPNRDPAPDAGGFVCQPTRPLDLVVLLDLSGSMAADFPGSGSKLDAARQAILSLTDRLATRGDGSRAALFSYAGFRTPEENLAQPLTVHQALTGDLTAVEAAASALSTQDLEPSSTTPSALALRRATELLLGDHDPTHQLAVIWLSDGIANIDDSGRGPDEYPLEALQAIRLIDGRGGFRPWGEVAWSGAFVGAFDTFVGEPLANTMAAIEALEAALPAGLIHGVAIQGDGTGFGTFNEDLLAYAAFHTGGMPFRAADHDDLMAAADGIVDHLECTDPGLGSIAGRVWHDIDGDRRPGMAEPGLAGVRVELLGIGDSVLASTTADGSGDYRFDGLAPGGYRVRVETSTLPEETDTPVHDRDGVTTPHRTAIDLTWAEAISDADFGYRGPGLDLAPTTVCDTDDFGDAQLAGTWQTVELGDADQGSFSESGGRLRLSGDGSALWITDNGFFVYQDVAGDFRAEVTVTDIPLDQGGAVRKAGLMVRDGLGTRDPRVMVNYVPHHPDPERRALQFGYRPAAGANGQEMIAPVDVFDLPVRLAIERRGDVFTTYYSLDGFRWTQHGDELVVMGDTLQVGLAVASYQTSTVMTAEFDDFALCRPRPEPAAPAAELECRPEPLDVVYLLDASGSMTTPLPGGPGRFQAAKDALAELNSALAEREDGSRAALVTFAGHRDPAANLALPAVVHRGLGDDFDGLASVLAALDPDDLTLDDTTPTALALGEVLALLLERQDSGRRPVVVLATDGVPNIDGRGFGPDAYPLEAVQAISLRDDEGGFRSPGEVAWSGPFDGVLGTFAGEPLANAMLAIEQLADTVDDLVLHGIAFEGTGQGLGTFADGLVAYGAHVTGGVDARATDTEDLSSAIQAIVALHDCPATSAGLLAGRVWFDVDQDGIQDPAEPGIDGVEIELEDALGDFLDSTTTSGDGRYQFTVDPGSYSIRLLDFDLPERVEIATFDADGLGTRHRIDVTLAVGEIRTDLDFGYATESEGPEPPTTSLCVDDPFDLPTLDPRWSLRALGDATSVTASPFEGRLVLEGDGSAPDGADDHGALLHRSLDGDFVVEVELSDFAADVGGPLRRAGLTVRAGTADDAPRVSLEVFPEGDFGVPSLRWSVRSTAGGTPTVLDQTDVFPPIRLALERRGDQIRARWSDDGGLQWNDFEAAGDEALELDLGSAVEVGLHTVGDGTTALAATFDNFEHCQPDGTPAPPLPPPFVCETEEPLDLIYLLDLSDSMTFGMPDADSRLEAAQEAILSLNATLLDRDDGSRVGLVTFGGFAGDGGGGGGGEALNAPTGGNAADKIHRDIELGEVELLVEDLTLDFESFDDLVRDLHPFNIDFGAPRPTSWALAAALELLADSGDPSHRPLVVLLTDGLPNLDSAGRGPAEYDPSELDSIGLRVGDEGPGDPEDFLPWGVVAWRGEPNPGIGTFDGEPLADTMFEILRLEAAFPSVTVTALGLGDDGFNPDLLDFAAEATGGQSLAAESLAELLALLPTVATEALCLAPPAADAEIGDRLWNDLDGDGFQDPAEPGLAGILVELLDEEENPLASAVSDGSGSYLFDGLLPGFYTVRVDAADLPPGLEPTFDPDGPASAHEVVLDLASGESLRTVDFGYAAPLGPEASGFLSGRVWHDLDGDGVQDPGEPGLPGVDLFVSNFDTGDFEFTNTGGDGHYQVAGLSAGTLEVFVDDFGLPPRLQVATWDFDGVDSFGQAFVSLGSGEVRRNVDFGFTTEELGPEPPITQVCFDDDFDDRQLDPRWTVRSLGDADATTVDEVVGVLRLTSDGSSPEGTLDHGAFVDQELTGDFRVEVDIQLPTGGGGSLRQAGILLRGNADAPRVALELLPEAPGIGRPMVRMSFRDTLGATTTVAAEQDFFFLDTLRLALERRGESVRSYYSFDGGFFWEPLLAGDDALALDLGTTVRAGLHASADDPAPVLSVDFDNARLCRPDDQPAPDDPPPVPCDPSQPFDLIYLLDLSGSMGEFIPGGDDRLSAAQDTLRALNDALAGRGDGSRAALVTFSGSEEFGGGPEALGVPAAKTVGSFPISKALSQTRVTGLTANLEQITDAIDEISIFDLDFSAPRSTSWGLATAFELLANELDPEHRPVIVLLTDGLPNVDSVSRGPVGYEADELDAIGLRDAGGEFLPWGTVAWLGDFNLELGTFDGQPLADSMFEIQRLKAAVPELVIHPLLIQVDGFNPQLYEHAAEHTGGTLFSATGAFELEDAASLVEEAVTCGPAGDGGVIGGRVWHDLDGDGLQDPGEPGIGGVALDLLDGDESLADSVTGDDGLYQFDGLDPAIYTVRVDSDTLPDGIDVPSFDLDGPATPDQASLTLALDESRLDVDFGYREPITGSAAGRLWHDLDGDGLEDPGEPGLAGVTVERLDLGGAVVDATTSDANGDYLLVGLDEGSTVLRVAVATLPTGLVLPTFDPDGVASPHAATLTLALGENRTDVDFGYRADLVPPTLTIDQPAEGSVVADPRPRIEITLDDVGLGIDAATLEVASTDGPLAVACGFANGRAECRPTAPLTDGPQTLTVTVRDLAGNPAADTVGFTVDSSLGTVTTTVVGRVELADGSPVSGAAVAVVGLVGAETTSGADGGFTLPAVVVTEDRPLVVVAVRDVAGNSQVATSPTTLPVADGTTDVGTLVLGPLCDPRVTPDILAVTPVTGVASDPGFSTSVRKVLLFDDGSGPALIAAGRFNFAGGTRVDHVARWDGRRWQPMGVGFNSQVDTLAIYDDGNGPALFAGGRFSERADGFAVNGIARWNGERWVRVGFGMNDGVRSLAVFDAGDGPQLYASGPFTLVDFGTAWHGEFLGQLADGFARWNGNRWQPVEPTSGDNPSGIERLTPWQRSGGTVLAADSSDGIVLWDGATWTLAVPFTPSELTDDLVVWDDTATGGSAGPRLVIASSRGVEVFDGTTLESLGSGLGRMLGLAVHDDGGGPRLYAAGSFDLGSTTVQTAVWDGTTWTQFGETLNFSGNRIVGLDSVGGDLVAGGAFSNHGRIAVLDGDTVDTFRWTPLRSGLDAPVRALTPFDDGTGEALYVAGDFTLFGRHQVGHIGRWDGREVLPLGTGLVDSALDGPVHALATFDDGSGAVLVAGGDFLTAGGVSAPRVARWNGLAWSPLGAGLDGTVHALATFDDGSGPTLLAGGDFPGGLARWDGTAWSTVGGGVDGTVRALAVHDDGSGPALFLAGDFTTAGAVAAQNLARWNGTVFAALGSGTDGPVSALAIHDDGTGSALFVGGDFTTAGGVATQNLARWNGTSFTTLGGGGGTDAPVLALHAFVDALDASSVLVVGGDFTQAAGAVADRLAVWDGVDLAATNAGTDAPVLALGSVDDGDGRALFLGGEFLTAGGVSSGRLARWHRLDCAAASSPPVITVLDPVDGLSTRQATIQVSGRVSEPAELTVADQPVPLADDRSFVGGPVPLVEGANTLELEAIDLDGEVGTAGVTVHRDTRGPSLGFVRPADGATDDITTVFGTPTLTVRYADAPGGAGVDPTTLAFTVDDLPVATTCDLGFDHARCLLDSPLADGSRRIAATVADGLGNVSNRAEITLVVDTTNGATTTLIGRVTLVGGATADGAEVRLLGTDRSTTTLADGTFELTGIDVTLAEPLRLLARLDPPTGTVSVVSEALTPIAGGITDAGTLVLDVPCDLEIADALLSAGIADGRVEALAVFDDGSGPALYAGGSFGDLGGRGLAHLARWDGERWSAVGGVDAGVPGSGFDGAVMALQVWDDGSGPALYAGGRFSTAGGVPALALARWDGTSWSEVGDGLGNPIGENTVASLTTFDDGTGEHLYVGGFFTTVGVRGTPTNASRIARWDGTGWSPLGSGATGIVWALTTFDDGSGDALYAGGVFQSIGGQTVRSVARWDGSAWSPLGFGVEANAPLGVFSFATFDDGRGPSLFAGGLFNRADSHVLANSIARWDGTTWSDLDGGVDSGGLSLPIQQGVQALRVFDDGSGPALYAAGEIRSGSGEPLAHIARWDGQRWHDVGGGFDLGDSGGMALAIFDDGGGSALYAGGGFTTAGGVPAAGIARWDGRWSPLGETPTGAIHALFHTDLGTGDRLYAAGDFVRAGAAVGGLAAWDGEAFGPLGDGLRRADGSTGLGRALVRFDDRLIVGGDFATALDSLDVTHSANHVVAWDGVGFAPLGTGRDAPLHALLVSDDGSGPQLHAAGEPGSDGPVARWNGATWTPLGTNTDGTALGGTVRTLASFPAGALIAGGDFADGIAQWNGTAWTALGDGVAGGGVRSLAVFDPGSGPVLVAGGDFTSAGGGAAQRIARWDGTAWSTILELEALLPGPVDTLAVVDPGTGPALFVAVGDRLWRWDGTTAAEVALGRSGGAILALAGAPFDAPQGPALDVGGSFPGRWVRLVATSDCHDRTAPSLVFTAPAPGSVVGEPFPTLTLDFADGGIGVDTTSLTILRDGSPFTVDCTFDGDAENGTASCVPTQPLADGPLSLSATIADLASNVSAPATLEVTVALVDAEPPSLVFVAPTAGATITESQPTLVLDFTDTGSGVDTASLALLRDGAPFAVDCTFTGDTASGTASCVPSQPLANGLVSLSATVADLAGNVSPIASLDFSVDLGDSEPPTLVFTTPTAGAVVADLQPTLVLDFDDVGLGVDPSTLVVLRDGAPLAVDCTFDGTTHSGSASCVPTLSLGNGAVSLSATVADLAGNVSPVASLDFSVDFDDSTPPTLVFTFPAEGVAATNATPLLELDYDDGVGGSGIEPTSLAISLAGEPLEVTCNDFPDSGTAGTLQCRPVDPVDEGELALRVTIGDRVGNVSLPATRSFFVDLSPPTVTFDVPTEGATVGAEPFLRLLWDDAGVGVNPVSLTVEANGVPLTLGCNSTPRDASCPALSPPLPNGPVTLTAVVEDGIGQPSEPAVRTITVDAVAPTVTLVSPTPGGLVASRSQRLVGTVSEAVTLEVFDTTLDRQTIVVAPDLSFDHGPVELREGTNTLTFEATDGVGLSSTLVVEVTVDSAAPTLAFTAPFDGAVLGTSPSTIELIAADGLSGLDPASLFLDVAGTVVTGCGFDDGSITCPSSVTLPEGENVLRARLSDLAGNETEAEISIFVDTVAPSVALVAPPDGGTADTLQPTVTLSWSDASAGVDPESLSLLWNGAPRAVTCDLDADGGTCTTDEPFADLTAVTVTATVADLGGNVSAPVSSTFTIDTSLDVTAPQIVLFEPAEIDVVVNDPLLVLRGVLSEGATLTLDGDPIAVAPDFTFEHGPVTLTDGLNSFGLQAIDPAGNIGSLGFTLTLDATAPAALDPALVTVGPSVDGVVAVSAAAGAIPVDEPGLEAVLTVLPVLASQRVSVAADGSFTTDVTAFLGDRLVIHVEDPAGNASNPVSFTIDGPLVVPPDPATLAPPLDPTVVADLCQQVGFLFTGPNAIQTGIAADTIDCDRIAVLSGRVLDRDLLPLAGARVSVADRPELGRTFSRADGTWDLVINGGGQPALDFVAAGRLPAQRRVEVGWEERQQLADVVLIELDTAVTPITLGAGSPAQIARGTLVDDGDGARRATVLFAAGTRAELELIGGATRSLDSLDFRASEYSVAPAGSRALPATLPPSVAYTYAVELSGDQALDTGATSVRFSQPVVFYLENFVGVPTGEIVPVGTYDRQRRQWIPSPNGRVIEILSIGGGVAELDVDGEGAAADAATLETLGINLEERQRLATLYTTGQTLWRAPLDHFTPVTIGWPFGPAQSLRNLSPELPAPGTADDLKIDIPARALVGADIEVENQIVGYALELTGTPWRLHYRSDRVPGRRAPYVLQVPISEAEVPSAVTGIELRVGIAGTETVEVFDPLPDQEFDFEWDTLDEYGRPVPGSEAAVAAVGYVYDGFFRQASPRDPSFAQIGGVVLEQRIREEKFVVSRETAVLMGTLNARRTFGLGGWSLSAHHYFDRKTGVLHLGNGERRTLGADAPAVLTRVAGVGTSGFNGDGLLARETELGGINGVFVMADGGLLLAEATTCRVRRIDPQTQRVETLAGRGCEDPTPGIGDGGPATAALLSLPQKAIQGPDGTIYIADSGNNRIRTIDPETGDIDTLAGIGERGSSGHGGRAQNAALGFVTDIALGPDGSLYLTESNRGIFVNGVPVLDQLRRIDTDGKIDIVAGGGLLFDPGPVDPNSVWVIDPQGVTVGFDNTIYLTHNHVLRRIGRDGLLSNVAGFTGGLNVAGLSGDGGPALDAQLFFPDQVAVARDGNIFFADNFTDRVRRVSPNGIINTIAGGGLAPPVDGIPATQALLFRPRSVALDPRGTTLYIADGQNIVWQMGVPGAFEGEETLVPSRDGSQFFVFDSDGRHLRTENAFSGEVLLTFHYEEFDLPDEGDGGGGPGPPPPALLLTEIEDSFGQSATIERDGEGTPLAIVAHLGQRTELEIHPDHRYLERARRNNTVGGNEVVQLTYEFGDDEIGLLRQLRDPKGNDYQHVYDELGRVTRVEDPANGSLDIDFQETLLGHKITATTANGRVNVFELEETPDGEIVQTQINASGLETEFRRSDDGTLTVTRPGGTEIEVTREPDPRLAALVLSAKTVTIETPGERLRTATNERTISTSDPEDPKALVTQLDSRTVSGRTETRSFDALTNEVVVLSPEGHRRVVVLDDFGRPIETRSEGIEPVRAEYDDLGRLERVTQGPEGVTQRVWTYAYDDRGRLELVTDPEEHELRYEYDDLSRITKAILPDDREFTFAYDLNGNVTELSPPSRPAHVLSHNPVNQVVEYDPPDVGEPPAEGEPEIVDSTLYTYNDDHQTVLVTRPDGKVIDIAYDGGGRVDRLTLPLGVIDYQYDGTTGNLSRIVAPDGGAIDFDFDGPLVESVTWSGEISGGFENDFDDSFRLVSRTLDEDAETQLSFGYNDDDQVVEVGIGAPEGSGGGSSANPLRGCLAGQEVGCLEIERDPVTRLAGRTTVGEVIDETTFDDFGELERYRVFFDSGGCVGGPCPDDLLLDLEYTERDLLGRLTEIRETRADPAGGSSQQLIRTFTYDDTSRLTTVTRNGVQAFHFDYDDNGNRTAITTLLGTRTATFDDQDRLLTFDGALYTYTANGELETRDVGGAVTHYRYDALGNLRGVTLPDGTDVEYLIDGLERRIGKKVDGVLERGWLYKDRLNPVAEIGADGEIRSLFVYGSKFHVPDVMVRDGNLYRMVSDHLGSIRLVVDTATGTVVQELTYDDVGRVLSDTNPGFQPFGYAGGHYDPLTGLVRFGARDYDPEVGRWTSKDPVGFAGGDLNLYAYVANDPINRTDPSGLVAPIVLGIWAGIEIGLTIYDAYTTGETLADPEASVGEKVTTTGLFVAGIFLPGGGYGAADDVAEGAIDLAGKSDEIVTLFKAPAKGRTGVAEEVVDGYSPGRYPGNGPYFSTDNGVAAEYMFHYQNGMQEIKIPRELYDKLVKDGVIVKDLDEVLSVHIPVEGLEAFNDAIRQGPPNVYWPQP